MFWWRSKRSRLVLVVVVLWWGYRADCEEVNMINRFAAKCDFMGGGRVKIWLAIDIRNLQLAQEQLRAWYCNPQQHIVVALEFSPYYWDGSERPTVLSVGQAYGFSGQPTKFGLSWSLEDRIKTQFLAKTSANAAAAGGKALNATAAGFTVKDVNNLMELSGQSAVTSILALRKVAQDKKKGGVNEAATLLSDAKRLAELTSEHKKSWRASWKLSDYETQKGGGGGSSDSKSSSKSSKSKGGSGGAAASASGGGGGGSSTATTTEEKVEQLMKTFGVDRCTFFIALLVCSLDCSIV